MAQAPGAKRKAGSFRCVQECSGQKPALRASQVPMTRQIEEGNVLTLFFAPSSLHWDAEVLIRGPPGARFADCQPTPAAYSILKAFKAEERV